MENLLRFKFDQKYCIFDFETEGLSLISSRPWQLAWGEAQGKKLISVQDHYLALDNFKISDKAAEVTRFNNKEYIRRREDPYHVFPMFWQVANSDDVFLVGHNILQFDNYILNILRLMLGLPTDYNFLSRCLDTNAFSIAVKKGLQPPQNADLLLWQYKLLNSRERGIKTNLSAMLRHYGIPFDKDKMHDAQYDIRKNFELFLSLIQELDI